MADFHFDFKAVEGMSYEEGLMALLTQFEDHYNSSQPKSFVFGASKPATGAPKRKEPEMVDVDAIAGPSTVAPVKHGPVDTETITPQTIGMKSFAIKDGKDLGLKAGDSILKGINEKNVEVFDKLLPGYDQQPYGPVVEGESGRYNLAWKPSK